MIMSILLFALYGLGLLGLGLLLVDSAVSPPETVADLPLALLGLLMALTPFIALGSWLLGL